MNGWTPNELWTTIRRARLLAVLVVYLGASFAVLEAVSLIGDGVGLPDWVTPFALVLLLVGLPIIVATALVQSAPPPSPEASVEVPAEFDAFARVEERTEQPTTASDVAAVAKHWLTWRKAITGGVLAFALLGVVTTGYMVMRTLGVGPVGSLVAAGVIDARDRIILADFENHTPDSLLAITVTETFRVDLSQSPVVSLAHRDYVKSVLERMRREPDSPLDEDLAREVAVRQGLKAVIVGEVGTAGSGYVLSAELISASDGEVFAAYRETAKDPDAIIRAIDRLSKRFRGKIGESLKSIRQEQPLEKVTTSSLEALRKYSQAMRAMDIEGDEARGLALLEEAIALDTTFAVAYRAIGITLSNRFEERARAFAAMSKAVEYAERLPDRERYKTLGDYYSTVTYEREKAITAFRTALDKYPDYVGALNNLAILYGDMRDHERALELYERALELDSTAVAIYTNVAERQVTLGRSDEAAYTLERMAANLPGHPWFHRAASALASSHGDYTAAEVELKELRESRKESLYWRGETSNWLGRLAQLRGHLAEAERHWQDAMAVGEERALPGEYLAAAFNLAQIDIFIRGEPAAARDRIEEALARYPFSSMDALDRPYNFLSQTYAHAGEPTKAKQFMAEYVTAVDSLFRRPQQPWTHYARGAIALAEERFSDAVAEWQRWYETGTNCYNCALPYLGMAYDHMGEADSARAIYERYIDSPEMWRAFWDTFHLHRIYERLGQLYEESGNPEKAIYYYGKFVELWQDADPELQPRVEAARRAIQALSTDR